MEATEGRLTGGAEEAWPRSPVWAVPRPLLTVPRPLLLLSLPLTPFSLWTLASTCACTPRENNVLTIKWIEWWGSGSRITYPDPIEICTAYGIFRRGKIVADNIHISLKVLMQSNYYAHKFFIFSPSPVLGSEPEQLARNYSVGNPDPHTDKDYGSGTLRSWSGS